MRGGSSTTVTGDDARRPPAGKVTYEEYLEWLDEDTWAEWVEGEIVMVSPASRRHQAIAGFLLSLFRLFLDRHPLGEVYSAPFVMKTGPDLPAREPDLLFVSREHLDRLREVSLEGPADLVVEIVSPASRLIDRGAKFAEYEAGGVREYWIIDPRDRRADFYVLGADGRYERVRPGDHGAFASHVLRGFRLQADWLWQEPLPRVSSLAKELGLL